MEKNGNKRSLGAQERIKNSKQNHGKIMYLSSLLEFSSLCFLVKAKIITLCDIVLNVHKEYI